VFTNLRAGAESGWDFSSRWFEDTLHLNTIETTNIVPVDLNSLLYQYEMILSAAAKAAGQDAKGRTYLQFANKRKAAVLKYCWNADLDYFFDYDFSQKHTTDKWTAAGVMPLFCQVATNEQAAGVKKNLEEKLVKDGGVVTSIYHTGQQWDAPNGWAPLQYIAVKGLMNYNYNELAKTIAERWMRVNEKVYQSSGKMLEKYNVENTNLESGGGEYPTQDGFGWSNGVYLKFYQLFKEKPLN
jgi:alpha,alpha-trehalase